MAIREGRWDCAACGRTANLGRELRCAGCGRARGKVKFYLPLNEPAVQQAEVLAMAKAGPDWVCAFCQASNRSTNQACTGCGAPREEGSVRATGGRDVTELTDAQKEQQRQARARLEEQARLAALRRRRMNKILVGLIGVVFVLCSGVATTFGFASRAGGTQGVGGPFIRVGAPSGGSDVELLSKVAMREIDVEAQRLVTEEAWCGAMPGGARELRRHSKQSGTRQVCEWAAPTRGSPLLGIAGFRVQEDMGNGFFSDSGSSGGSSSSDWGSSSDSGSSSSCTSVPTYEDWCAYEVMRWIVVRSPQNTDTVTVPPWPPVQLAPGERKGASIEAYEGLLLTRDGEKITLQVPQSQWIAWQQGVRYEAQWSFFGGLRSVGGPMHGSSTASR